MRLGFGLQFWSGRAIATGTAWAGLCLIHHQITPVCSIIIISKSDFWCVFSGCWRALAKGTAWAGFNCAILLLLDFWCVMWQCGVRTLCVGLTRPHEKGCGTTGRGRLIDRWRAATRAAAATPPTRWGSRAMLRSGCRRIAPPTSRARAVAAAAPPTRWGSRVMLRSECRRIAPPPSRARPKRKATRVASPAHCRSQAPRRPPLPRRTRRSSTRPSSSAAHAAPASASSARRRA